MNLNGGLTPDSYLKGPITLDKKSNTASMVVSFKGHRLSVKVGYSSSNFNESQAANDLESTLVKMLALEHHVKVLHPGLETRQLLLEKSRNILIYEPLLTEEQALSDIPPLYIHSAETINRDYQEETKKLKSKSLTAQANEKYTAIEKVKEIFTQSMSEKRQPKGAQAMAQEFSLEYLPGDKEVQSQKAMAQKTIESILGQRFTAIEAQRLVIKQGKGAFAIYERPGTGEKMICCQTAEGKYQEIRCIPKDGRWGVGDQTFDSLADILMHSNYANLLARPVRNPEPFLKINKRYDFWMPPVYPEIEEIQKYPPDKLLDLSSRGVPMTPYQFLSAADQIHVSLPKAAIGNPGILTTMHKLYEKAAELMLDQGDIIEAFRIRTMAAENVECSPSHPLQGMKTAIVEGTKLQANPFFGAHFSGLDSGVLKGGHLRAWRRKLENNKEMNCFEFKVSKYARNDIQENIKAIKDNLNTFKTSLPDLLKGHEVTIDDRASFVFHGVNSEGVMDFRNEYAPSSAKAIVIEFKGIGKIVIGNANHYGCLSNDVLVEMDPGVSNDLELKALHQMLTVLGFGPILGIQRQEDELKLKIAQIFRAFFPAQAIEMEQAKEFYEMPPDELMEKIARRVPSMRNLFKKYLQDNPELMYQDDIYPGRSVWCIADLAGQVKAKGSYGLMSGIGQSSFENGMKSAARLLKEGALSSQDRFLNGKFHQGVSSNLDLASGGGDQVFTRMITKNLTQERIEDINFHGSIQVLWDLSAINRVSYGYLDDNYGVKNPHDKNYSLYETRHTLMELAARIDSSNAENEVMVKNRIGPEFVQGFVVRNDSEKKQLIEYFRQNGLITKEGGQEMIHGYPVDQFIYASATFNQAMWKKRPAEIAFEKGFLGKRTDDEAERLLESQKIGTYVIYQQEASPHYHLAFVDSENEVAFVYNQSEHELKRLLSQTTNELKFPLK